MFTRTTIKRAGAALIAASMLALAGCSADDTAGTPAASEQDTTWTYTDAVGKTVTLDHTPTKIAGFVDQMGSIMSYGIKPVALFGRQDVASDPRLADADLSDVAIVGNVYGEIDLEALAAAQPELIVTAIYPTDREGTFITEGPFYGFADVEQQKQIEKIAPIVTIAVDGNGLDVITEIADLAVSLGADADAVSADKTEFDSAVATLTETAKARPEIEVTSMYAGADGVYITKVADEPMTQMYAEFGVNLTNLNPEGDYYWDIYSWENVGKMFTSDILLPNYEGLQADELAKQPTFAKNPALVAEQVYTWSYPFMDYTNQAESLAQLSDYIKNAKDVAESK